MPIDYNHIRCVVNVDVLRANFELLRARAQEDEACLREGERVCEMIPVVKADAYGHGLVSCAKALAADLYADGSPNQPAHAGAELVSPGARLLAVGTAEEGARLREAGFAGRIMVLLGVVAEASAEGDALHQDDAELCVTHALTPVLSRLEQCARLSQASVRLGRPAAMAVKVDTGMARLGFSEATLPDVIDALKTLPGLRPLWLVSHLATADEPESEAYVRAQAERFDRFRDAFDAAGLPMRACLANSAGLLAHKCVHYDGVRPGIALYGANPFHGGPWEAQGAGLQLAMRVTAPVYQVHPLRAGESISYGRTFTAQRDMTVAVVGAGYADGYARTLSNKAAMGVRGRLAPVVGRVCMQMTAVDVSAIPTVRAGDEATLLGAGDTAAGESVSVEALAGWWGTIPYEVFCILGLNRTSHTGRLAAVEWP